MTYVYICHPYGGDYNNIERAMDACIRARKRDPDIVPVFIPLLFHGCMRDTVFEDRAAGLAFCLRVMPLCSYVFVCGDNISAGMADEIANAHRMGMEIVYDND